MKFDVKVILEYNEKIEASSKEDAKDILLREKLVEGGELVEIEVRDEEGNLILEDEE